MQRPRVALDLHYLVSFYGSELELEPQRLLGSVVRTLHVQPILTPSMILETIPSFPFLAGSNLADEVELVKFTPLPLSLEELSKLWSVFFQIPYTLSVAYQGTVVLIESDDGARTALPVRGRNVYVRPFRRPVIVAVVPDRLDPGATVALRGRGLAGDVTRVRFGDTIVTPAGVTDREITVALPAVLPAGVNGVQVVHELALGTPPTPHRGTESNVAPFILKPRITTPLPISAARGATLALAVSPSVARRQRVALLVGEAEIRIGPRPETDPQTTTQLEFSIPADLPTGEFLLRLQIDGADSELEADATGQFVGPKVTIT
jgi:hypothetical protein